MIRLHTLSKYHAFIPGALNFKFGIGVGLRHEGPNRGACERTTTDILNPTELNL